MPDAKPSQSQVENEVFTAMMQLHGALGDAVRDKFRNTERNYKCRMAAFNAAVTRLGDGTDKSRMKIFAKAATFVHDAEYATLLAQDPRRHAEGLRIVEQLETAGGAEQRAKLVDAYRQGNFGAPGSFAEQMFNPPELSPGGGKSRTYGEGVRQMRAMGY